MKRSRAPNFTTAEIMHLLELVEKYPILENKKTDGATTKEKHIAWQKLAAEYNSQTNYSPRTADNLLHCYKNQKIKVKKGHSSEKMTITAPVLLNAVEEHGQDWDRVAQATETSSSDCQNTFELLVKQAKQEEVIHKKEINRTGGGPPPPPSCSNLITEKVKSLMGPSLEGLYTMYDGDAEFMKEQQASVSTDRQLQPIEITLLDEEHSPKIERGCTSNHQNNKSDQKRLNVMKRKIDPSLESFQKGKKKHVSLSFQELAEDKKDLVKAQKTLADYQIQHQLLQIEVTKEQLQFQKKKNQMELEFLEQKYKLELDNIRNKKP